MPRSLPRLNARVMGTFLIVGLPALAIALVIVLGVGQSRLRTSYGQHLAEVANYTAAMADASIYQRVLSASLLARVPDVRTVAAASREAANPEQIRTIDREWQKRGGPPPAFKAMLDSPASRFLAEVRKSDPIFREILVSDLQGRLVAASNPTSDYFQADEPWWTEAFGDGVSGQVSVGDVQWDQSARVWALDIAVPVPEPGSDRLVGIMKVVADIRELGVVVDSVRLGQSGQASLIREDGSIVFSRRRMDPDSRFFATDLLRERYAAAENDDPQFHVTFTARGPDGRDRVVAVAPGQLDASYPHLAWLVAVSQDEAELLAPIRELTWLLVAVLALVAVAVLALALWFSMRLAAPTMDEALDMRLVEHAKAPHLEHST